jgi:tellurite resistance protein TerC
VLYVALGALAAVLALVYWLEARDARRGAVAAPARVRRAAMWSAAWLALGLVPIAIFGVIEGAGAASSYAAVYLIERALSLDNVFVFAVLISAFAIPMSEREELVSWGALAAFALRIPAIFLGVALFDASHLVAYALGALLLVLAWQTARAGGEEGRQGSRVVDYLQRRLPVGEPAGRRLIVVRDGRRLLTPMLLCLIAIMVADLTFAVDSIPAALAISHDRALLLTANLLALLGLRSLFQLVAVARESLRYMDRTIAVLLALVGLKLLSAQVYEVGPLASLLAVLVVLGIGVGLSLRAGSRVREPARDAARDD